MDTTRLAGSLLDTPMGSPLLALANWMLWRDALRRPLLRTVERTLRAQLQRPDVAFAGSRRIARERMLLALAILDTVDRLIRRRCLSPQVAHVSLGLWARAALQQPCDVPAGRRFRAQFGCDPPWFITVSPGHACNLRCSGCYADSGDGSARLPWAVFDRIIREARELWGAPLVVLSGGEPLAYRSEGHDLLDAVEAHHDTMFLMFTNGTLIDREVAKRLGRLGNLTAAISVEGLRDRTDERRGAGCFDNVLQAMAHLREAGVPFGVSATATRHNCEELLSDEFLDYFFGEQGAFYSFLFHYMPIGRSPDLESMPTPQQRLEFWRRSWEVVERKRIFLFDFWNSGPLAQGCLSAGREGGYIYIDWNGKVMPCVFAPYSVANIQEAYAQGKTLNDIWQAPFFQAIRQWQRECGYGQQPCAQGNWLRPCPVRDHHALFHQWVQEHAPEPENEAAQAALLDDEYCRGLVAYGQGVQECTQPIWEAQYLASEGPQP
jgi:MoaA/NifB/PqqE/SkfB family radical SAM enzyme